MRKARKKRKPSSATSACRSRRTSNRTDPERRYEQSQRLLEPGIQDERTPHALYGSLGRPRKIHSLLGEGI
ncbi:hypothetical protein EXS56_03030 [Candidatus Kaiserbacteria bacterium]|nr:hypothetical protein [Candidatus Kaiserbacteria bacterium]